MTQVSRYPTTPMCDGPFLARFEPTTRDSDVFVTTTAKCGQTWLMNLMWHLRTRGHQPDLEGGQLLGRMPWLELPYDVRTQVLHDHGDRLAALEAMEDPRIFKLHVVFEEVPRPEGSAAKVVTITRDPRDVPYSMFAHLCGMAEGRRPPGFVEDFDVYFERWFELGLYFRMVRSYWEHRDAPGFLWLSYEALKHDIHGQARRLVDFLGWPLTDADIARAVPFASLTHMQALEDRDQIAGGGGSVWKPGSRFVREGAVGRNRARLSASQESRILERARAEFDPELYARVVVQA